MEQSIVTRDVCVSKYMSSLSLWMKTKQERRDWKDRVILLPMCYRHMENKRGIETITYASRSPSFIGLDLTNSR